MVTPTVYILGNDPSTTHRLNACAYQQSAITTFAGLQYVAFYTSKSPSGPRFVTIARHNIQNHSSWQFLTFEDYEQTTDDGHNTISIGICEGDGTIHVAFDHHCDTLKYRVSRVGLAGDPRKSSWKADNFAPIQSHLPGNLGSSGGEGLANVTYPRFVPAGDQLYFECRIGKAGAGSDILYRYDSRPARYTLLGTYLIGDKCNPYPNGLSFDRKTNCLHVTWTNRHFIAYEGADDQTSTAHKAQAGPNGPENNEGLYHACSSDGGVTWTNSIQEPVAVLSSKVGSGLDSQDGRLRVKDIPRDSGIMNQEAQYVDDDGGIHVLNRENTSGQEIWMHYYCSPADGAWSFSVLPLMHPSTTGPRGKVLHHAEADTVLFILPSNTERELVIMRSRSNIQGSDRDFEIIWRGEGYTGEPLVDEESFSQAGLLSILILHEDADDRKVVVLQFDMMDVV
ncbi:hypothetical protein ASPWEDRAFT_116380 [Aspergillus wentii DTO 134E9]|uniref:Dockerin type 1 n=1 Tax=Aspergillus wentii DTO 134E9 TaxID=1073089 RepID=A0A1L9REF5_ASPWE|nr:uncharacterized protein ASPWEDRAFT_116380 [Aspergillus wentii DTO 134E9]KAI9933511.1 hypothetical protein MW887_007984 [Aspergillus wentii]OJJ33257.1 hypothetical protein ASPWEDRAFT_116380 [Aspergillus wentii DTO 134E9]